MEKVRLYEMGPYKSYNPGSFPFRSFHFVPLSQTADDSSVNDVENKDSSPWVVG